MPTAPINHKTASSLRSTGGTRRWRAIRSQAIKRDKGLCVMCLEHGRYTRATEVDHIKSRASGGADSLDNLRSLCAAHHKGITNCQNGGKDMSCDSNGIPRDASHHWNSEGMPPFKSSVR